MSQVGRRVFCPACGELLQWQHEEMWERQVLYVRTPESNFH
jgi:hypothetical protein